MGQEEHVSPIFMNILEVMTFRLGLFYPVTATTVYFNANIMCSFTKKLQLLGDFVPQLPYLGSAPGPRWGTSGPQTSSLLLYLPNNPVRSTSLAMIAN